MKISVVIPARLGSTRFPKKILASLGGKPILWHVWSAAKKMTQVDEVVVAVDDEGVQSLVQSWGGDARMTGQGCISGMERTSTLIESLKGDFIINLQADEPFIDPRLLDDLAKKGKESEADIVTPVFRITDSESIFSSHVVKVVRSLTGQALYFSRNAIPYVRDFPREQWLDRAPFYGHIGVYGCKRKLLENYKKIPSSILENAECLEQLRFMEAGYSIQTIETTYHALGIDTPQDLEKAQSLLEALS